MLDMKDATTEDFAALEGQAFCITGLDADISLVLSEVKRLGSGERKGGAFSTLWQGPTSPGLAQGAYSLSQASFGTHEIFLVPVAQSEAGFQYEAVFT